MKQLFLPKLLGVGAALLLAASLISFPAQAQTTIDVACNAAALRTAINTANGTPQVDTLNLAAACAYNFTAADATDPDTALPGITTPIVVNGNDATIARTGGPAFRLLYVTSTGNLTLDNATVTGGIANVSGGGIRSSGTLTVTNSTVSGNSAGFGGGIFNAGGGTLTVTNSTLSGNSANNAGGGIDNSGTLTVTNSTFSGNSA
jgi:hypothetical protein